MDVDGEVFTHESLMTENEDNDNQDENINELRNLLIDEQDEDNHDSINIHKIELNDDDNNNNINIIKNKFS